MKKNRIYGLMGKIGLFKMIKIMRFTIFMLFLSLSQTFAMNSYSQQAKLSLDMRNARVEDVIDRIEKNSEFFFMYNKNMIDVDRKVDIQVEEKSVNEVLDKIFANTGITYLIKDRQILLINNRMVDTGNESITQQQKSVSGKVIDSSGAPLPGVSVVVKGTTNGTITDSDGKYTITKLPVNAMLVFSFVGMKNQEVSGNEKTTINVTMVEESVGLEEVVAVGYSMQKKADLTGSVSVVSVKDIKGSIVGNSMKSIQGKVPGVQIISDGTPNGYATVRIRGIGTLGNNDPLYVIDGIPTKRPMNELASLDIESIQVLKDASSASIYGSRAANGVIIITTKKAKAGITQVSVNSSLSITATPNPYSMLNTEQLGIVRYWALRNSGQSPNVAPYTYEDHKDTNDNWVIDKVILPEFLDVSKTMKPSDTNWQDEIFRRGIIQQYNVSLSSANDRGHVWSGIDYYGNNGVLDGSYFKRFNVRVNSDYSLLKGHLKIGENLTLTKLRGDAYNTGYGTKATVIYQARSLWSITPVHTIDGIGWGGSSSGMTDFQNPIRLIEDNRQNYYDRVRIFGNTFIDLEINKNLHFYSKAGIDYTGTWQRIMEYPYVNGFVQSTKSSTSVSSDYSGGWVVNNTLNYDLSIKKSIFNIMLGQENSFSQYNVIWGSREKYALLNDDYMQIDAGQENRQNGGGAFKYSLVSFFGKINYSLTQRYLASFTLRRDGSSRFGSNNVYGTFPAFSFGWRLSEESFFKRSFPIFSDLKLRYGWGKTGNQEIGNYASYGQYVPIYGTDPTWNADGGTAYDINGADSGALSSGFVRTQRSNPNLKWETSLTNNFGLDFGLFDSVITGSFDYYTKKTSDILINPPVIAVLGEGANQYLNGATLSNRGFEVLINFKKKISDCLLDLTVNASHNHNKVVYLPDNVVAAYAGNGNDQTILGHPLNSMFGYVADGLFQSQAEVDAHASQPGAAPGRIRYRDIDNNGKINDLDRTWIGVSDPDLIYGVNMSITWRNFDFSLLFNGLLGGDIVNSNKSWTDFLSLRGGYNAGTRTLDAWTPKNSSSTIPSLTINDNNNEARFSSYFVESSSYLKLRNIEIGYSLPNGLAKLAWISNARVYLRGDNLITIKKTWGNNKYTGLDPETPVESYPIPFSLTLGLNVTF